MVVDGTWCGKPAARTAARPGVAACSPTWLTHPMMTSSIVPGSIPFRWTSARRVPARSSTGWMPQSAPPALPRPIGVLTASTIIGTLATPNSRPDVIPPGVPARPNIFARNAFLSGLPRPVIGMASANSIALGAQIGPFFSRTQPISSCSSILVPARHTTIARTDSPHLASGTPITAALRTDGCCDSTSSTSRGYTLKPPGDDDVLAAIHDVAEAFFVHACHVAGTQPSVPESLGSFLRPSPVAVRHQRPAHADLPDFAERHLVVLLVEQLELDIDARTPAGRKALRLRQIVFLAAQRRHHHRGFSLPVILEKDRAEMRDALAQPRRDHRRSAVQHHFQAGRVVCLQRRMVQEHVKHRRHQRRHRDAISLDRLKKAFPD